MNPVSGGHQGGGPHATRITLCGPLSVEIEGRQITPPGRQGRMLLSYLVANRSRPVRRDELIEVIWEGSAPASPDALLSTLLSRARVALGGDRLVGHPHVSLRLPEDSWIDLEAIDAQAGQALDALGRGEPREAVRLARDTLALMDAELLAGLEGSWIDERRRHLADLRLSLLEVSVEAGLLVGGVELQSAERTARLLIDQAPYRESAYALLMRIYAARGDSAEAVRVYDGLRVLLREELGTAPGPEITALNERLLRQEAIAPASASTAGPGEPPASGAPEEEVPLPPLLASMLDERFVGREELRRRIGERWEASSSRTRAVALTGEPGIGKTRLAACFAKQVHMAGATVLYGRCDAEPLTSYQPFVEALNHYLRHADVPRLGAELPDEIAELRRLPSLCGRLGSGVEAEPSGGGDRYALFEAIGSVIRWAGRARPVLLVLDDLHWADGPTFQLLLHLLRAVEPTRCLFLATLRDVDAAPAAVTGDERAVEPPEARIAALRRESDVDRLCLEGFDERETAEFISARGGDGPGEPSARCLAELTGGNPFFMAEALRSLTARPLGDHDGDLELLGLGVPEGVREVVIRRLEALGPGPSEVIAAASVIGPELRLDLLEGVVDLPPPSVLDAVEHLVDAGLLVEVATKLDHFAFSHALVRETQYRRLLASRRVRLHEKIGLELERRAASSGDAERVAPAELAHHFYEARRRVGLERAVQYVTEAASHASRSLAYEQAAAHCARAVEVLEEADEPDEDRVCDLRLSQGRALMQAARVDNARDAFRAAAESARRRGEVDQLVRAALGFHGRHTAAGEVHTERIELLEEALTALGPADSALRARVLARLADSLLWVAGDRAADLSCEAVATARRVGDRSAMLESLAGRHAALLHVEHLEERLRIGRERLEIAEAADDREAIVATLRWDIYDLCERGDIPTAREQHAALVERSKQLRQPLYFGYAGEWASVFAQLEGRFEEAERLADEVFEHLMRIQPVHAEMHRVNMLLPIYREQGRLDALRPQVERFARDIPIAAWTALLALVDAETGNPAEARPQLDRLLANGGTDIARDVFWLFCVAVLAETCARTEDAAEPAATVYELLTPYSDLCMQAGSAAWWGSVSRFLGLAATACGDWDAADNHFAAATRRNEQLGCAPLTARARVDHADMLLRQGDPARRGEAGDLLDEATAVAEPIGMVVLCRRAEGLRAQAAGGAVVA